MILPVSLGAQSYEIVLRRGALDHLDFDLNRRVLVVTDSGVPEQYARRVMAQCAQPTLAVLPAGEGSKSFTELQRLLSVLLHASFGRSDCVVAVGGGVVGDLSGFAAACYMRGIDFYNLPTTLLSQVDSSIGGKTAVDFEGVKNAIGAFHQPKRVIIDPETLNTLDARQRRAGLAEAIKMAATGDAALFSYLESTAAPDPAKVIEHSLRYKASVVQQDPTEHGLRRVLNFGHTIGHAIESFYGGKLLHGECVALGMLPMCSAEVRPRLRRVLELHGLPTHCALTADELLPYLLYDKKRQADRFIAVTVEEVGTFALRELTAREICRLWEENA